MAKENLGTPVTRDSDGAIGWVDADGIFTEDVKEETVDDRFEAVFAEEEDTFIVGADRAGAPSARQHPTFSDKPGPAEVFTKTLGTSFLNIFEKSVQGSRFDEEKTFAEVQTKRAEMAEQLGFIDRDKVVTESRDKAFIGKKGGLSYWYARMTPEQNAQVDAAMGEDRDTAYKSARAQEYINFPGMKAMSLPELTGFVNKTASISANLVAFMTKVGLTTYGFGGGTGASLMAWEMVNQAEGGIPGQGLFVRGTLGMIGKVPTGSTAGKIAKVASESGLFAGVTAISGGTAEDILVSALLPVAFNALHFTQQRVHLQNYEAGLKSAALRSHNVRLKQGVDNPLSRAKLKADLRFVDKQVKAAKVRIYNDDAFAPAKEKWETQRQAALKKVASGNNQREFSHKNKAGKKVYKLSEVQEGQAILDFLDKRPGEGAKLDVQIKEIKAATKAATKGQFDIDAVDVKPSKGVDKYIPNVVKIKGVTPVDVAPLVPSGLSPAEKEAAKLISEGSDTSKAKAEEMVREAVKELPTVDTETVEVIDPLKAMDDAYKADDLDAAYIARDSILKSYADADVDVRSNAESAVIEMERKRLSPEEKEGKTTGEVTQGIIRKMSIRDFSLQLSVQEIQDMSDSTLYDLAYSVGIEPDKYRSKQNPIESLKSDLIEKIKPKAKADITKPLPIERERAVQTLITSGRPEASAREQVSKIESKEELDNFMSLVKGPEAKTEKVDAPLLSSLNSFKLTSLGFGAGPSEEVIASLGQNADRFIQSLPPNFQATSNDPIINEKKLKEKAKKFLFDISPEGIATAAVKQVHQATSNEILLLASEKGLIVQGKVTPLFKKMAFDSTQVDNLKGMSIDELNRFKKHITTSNTLNNKLVVSRETKSSDNEADMIPDTPLLARELQNLMKRKHKAMKKNARRTKKVSDETGRVADQFQNLAPTRLEMSRFEENTGTIVEFPWLKLEEKVDLVENEANENFAHAMSADPDGSENIKLDRKHLDNLTSHTTIAAQERIKKYLFSPETKAKVINDMSEAEILLAEKFNYFLQEGDGARTRMESALRLWLDENKIPGDQKGKEPKFTDEQAKLILEGAKQARKEGKFSAYANGLFDLGPDARFGLRESYIQAEGQTDFKLDETGSADPLEDFGAGSAKLPNLSGAADQSRTRKVSRIKRGNIFTNVLTAYKRAKIRNEAAQDIAMLVDRFNEVDLSPADKLYLKDLFDSVLRSPQILRQPFRTTTKASGVFWLATLSPLTNGIRPIVMVARNGMQPIAEGGQVYYVRDFVKNSKKVATAMLTGNLHELDQEMAEDLRRKFSGHISQMQSIYSEHMFIDQGKKANAIGLKGKGKEFAKYLLHKTGGLYVGIDTLDRYISWPTVYMGVKQAALDFKAGTITEKRFMDKTGIDVMMKDAQIETAIDLFQSNKIREFANYLADIQVQDVHRSYRVTGRSGSERTAEQRSITGIWTYPRGVYDLYMNRGIKRIFEGLKEGNVGKTKRAVNSVAKGLLGRSIANMILLTLGMPVAYHLARAGYTLLQPAVSIIAEGTSDISRIAYRYSNGDITKGEAIKQISNVLYDTLDDFIKVLPNRTTQEEKDEENKKKTTIK